MEADKAVGKTLESVSQSTGQAGRSGTGREDLGMGRRSEGQASEHSPTVAFFFGLPTNSQIKTQRLINYECLALGLSH